MNNIFLNFVKAQLIMKLVGRRGEESVSSQTKQRRERGESSLGEQEESHAQQSFVNMGEMKRRVERSGHLTIITQPTTNTTTDTAGEGRNGNEWKVLPDLRATVHLKWDRIIGIGDQHCSEF